MWQRYKIRHEPGYFLHSFGEDRTNMSAPRRAKIRSKRVLFFIKLLTEESKEACRRKYLHSLYVLTPAVTSSFRFPFWLSSGVSLRKPGVGQNADIHALPTARNSNFVSFASTAHSTSFSLFFFRRKVSCNVHNDSDLYWRSD